MAFVCVFQVKQREEETQCSKMILRFREDKIQRLETLSDGNLTTNTYLLEEKNAALRELQLIRNEKGCNPEVTRFAMENMRLQEQLRKYGADRYCACVAYGLRFDIVDWCQAQYKSKVYFT